MYVKFAIKKGLKDHTKIKGKKKNLLTNVYYNKNFKGKK